MLPSSDEMPTSMISPMSDAVAVTNKFGEYFSIPLDIIEKMRDYTWKYNEEKLLKYGQNWQEIFRSSFQVPTLIIHDEEDKEISISDSECLVKTWNWAELVKTKGLGHRRILYDKMVLQKVVGFIKEDTRI